MRTAETVETLRRKMEGTDAVGKDLTSKNTCAAALEKN